MGFESYNTRKVLKIIYGWYWIHFLYSTFKSHYKFGEYVSLKENNRLSKLIIYRKILQNVKAKTTNQTFSSWVGSVISFGMEADGVVVVVVAVVLAAAAVITGQLVQQFFVQVLQWLSVEVVAAVLVMKLLHAAL